MTLLNGSYFYVKITRNWLIDGYNKDKFSLNIFYC